MVEVELPLAVALPVASLRASDPAHMPQPRVTDEHELEYYESRTELGFHQKLGAENGKYVKPYLTILQST